MNILLTAISVGMVKFILVSTGLAVSYRMQNERFQSLAPLLTGLIFVAIAILEYV
jgi:putative Mn2+ efflux pump MntP